MQNFPFYPKMTAKNNRRGLFRVIGEHRSGTYTVYRLTVYRLSRTVAVDNFFTRLQP
jgi:hypothetical protein